MTDSKHNLDARLGISAGQLRAYIVRVEDLEEEIKALNGDKREVYAEAKAAGFDKNTVRAVVRRRAKDGGELQEADALLELYEAALLGSRKDPLE